MKELRFNIYAPALLNEIADAALMKNMGVLKIPLELNKGDATFFVTQICEGEEDAVNELLEIVIPKIIQEEGRAASFRLEEMAIEANNNLKKSI